MELGLENRELKGSCHHPNNARGKYLTIVLVGRLNIAEAKEIICLENGE